MFLKTIGKTDLSKVSNGQVTRYLWVLPALLLVEMSPNSALALPSPEETPEEVLRTEIITSARSPIDGKPLTAAQYAQLQAQLQNNRESPQLNSVVEDKVFLLRIRRLIRTVLPFLPI